MPVDFTFLEPDGLQIHIRLNSLLSGHGFFRSMTPEAKRQFDEDVEKIISEYLPYSEDAPTTPAPPVVTEWQLVPKEPTPDMRIAGATAWSEALPTAGTYVDSADACYKAMLAATPATPMVTAVEMAMGDRKELANELERLYNLDHEMLRGSPWDQVLHDHYVRFLQKHASEFIAALRSHAPPMVTEALANGSFAMSEPYLSGYRVIIGFETRKGAQDALRAVATLMDDKREGRS